MIAIIHATHTPTPTLELKPKKKAAEAYLNFTYACVTLSPNVLCCNTRSERNMRPKSSAQLSRMAQLKRFFLLANGREGLQPVQKRKEEEKKDSTAVLLDDCLHRKGSGRMEQTCRSASKEHSFPSVIVCLRHVRYK